jgi:hypothetical protein
MTTILIIQSVLLLFVFIEIIKLRKNRLAFEELILKFVDVCQKIYKDGENHNKKLSDNVVGISKSLQSSISLKESIKALEGIMKELQATSKFLKVGLVKEFKDIESSIIKIKSSLK